MKPPNRITLRVWGDFACFTRPEMKVERVSYPVMTPSAARAQGSCLANDTGYSASGYPPSIQTP